ncbi:NnrS family protein OS=Bosea thiooxidans OX=53254 GN=SAMN05660750_05059 PE=4 SV=1 [Bosea thiooxidans]|uniref:NnrS family protein n=1 Tax=Bosea thiooxidans TaxID=53254 RepID=A0A1T5H9W0_9HYPH|nr:hypothetical protein [Bosea thiooxidans]SKC17350.1 hypothetical protein SAMN05660750_05059 [Bosea thiooxidans]
MARLHEGEGMAARRVVVRFLHSRGAVRAPLLATAAIALLAGVYAGFGRLGWDIPHASALAELHGPLLLCGLFGTLVSLERAVAIGRGWAYAAPALSGVGTLVLLAGAPVPAAAGVYALAAAVLVGGSLVITMLQPALFTGTLLFGALAWLAGNLLWAMGSPIVDVVGWWLTFLILTIAAERLELSRLRAPKRGSEALFLFALGMLLAGAQNGITTRNGSTLFGIALLVMMGWLLRHDIAWANLRRTGQARFMAICMVAGYAWLGAAGLALMGFPPGASPFSYDIALHAILTGFVFSMVFGHALIILPAIVRLRVRYAAILYAPLFLLHGAVALRVAAGLAEWGAGRAASGALTGLALASFALALVLSSRRLRFATIDGVRSSR